MSKVDDVSHSSLFTNDRLSTASPLIDHGAEGKHHPAT